MRVLISFCAAFVLAACARIPIPLTHVRGDDAGLRAIQGKWEGDYWTDGIHDRAGSIYFNVGAGVDAARGQVLMLSQKQQPPAVVIGRDPWRNPVFAAQVLSIQFVSATGDSIRGSMDPYTDPVCGCELKTTFRGRIRGNQAEGTFLSIHEDGQRTGGRWRATRMRIDVADEGRK